MGARTNLAYNALDVHVKQGWGGHTAMIYLNEREKTTFHIRKTITYENAGSVTEARKAWQGPTINVHVIFCLVIDNNPRSG